ncbi:MAG TPA: ABC transporter permease [Bradyrhizobium sp.]|nr:ABC transporter permease [Bradyrhizobium sp.]
MFGYYLDLALRSLKRNPVLTGLMIIAIGFGIGTSMTSLSVSRAMSGDPIPEKSHQLFMVQIDSWGPDKRGERNEDGLDENMSYIEAMALRNLHAAQRQTRIYSTYMNALPADPKLKPVGIIVPSVDSDFFSMFNAPFRFGAPWSQSDDQESSPVVVISRKLNDQFFAGANSVGKTFMLGGDSYRVVGVLDNWPLVPRFYNLHIRPYGQIDEIFIPFTRAIKAQAPAASGMSCQETSTASFEVRLLSECLWIQLWVELPAVTDVVKFRNVLNNYALDQQRAGRFHWPPHTQLRDVMQWLEYRHIVPNELGLLVLASFGFLFVCLMNAMGLMLARIIGRTQDISVRRALGASRKAIIRQCLVETTVIGVLGAILGLLLTMLGVLAMRAALADDFAALAYLNARAIGIEVLLAIAATIGAGLYPTWRAAHVEPALQLKAE